MNMVPKHWTEIHLSNGDSVHLALDGNPAELQLKAAELAEGELNYRELLAKLLVQLLLHVRGSHVLNDARLMRGKIIN